MYEEIVVSIDALEEGSSIYRKMGGGVKHAGQIIWLGFLPPSLDLNLGSDFRLSGHSEILEAGSSSDKARLDYCRLQRG